MKEKLRGNTKVIILILGIMLTIIGVTYSYLAPLINGVEKESTIAFNSGMIKITYNGSNMIVAENIIPGWSSTKEFTVVGYNNTSVTDEGIMDYAIKLVVEENTFTYGAIRFELNGSSTNDDDTLAPLTGNVPTREGRTLVGTARFNQDDSIKSDVTHTYSLKISFPNDPNKSQNENMNKTFKGYVVIEEGTLLATTYVENLYNNSINGMNDLMKDNTTDENLRYVGSNPNNYVSFNNELWRIIGIFDTYDATESGETLSTHSKKIKLIRAEPIGDYAFDVSENGECSGYGCNGYNVSNLMQELNGDYLNNSLTSNPKWYGGEFDSSSNTSQKEFDRTKVIKASYQDMIANVVWNTGGILDSDIDQATFAFPTINAYNAERSSNLYTGDSIKRTSTWNGKIGLMYYSDYGYSSKDAECRSNLWAGVNMNGSTEEEIFANMKCKNENWLNIVPEGYSTTYENPYGWWTLSSSAESGSGQFYVFSIGGGYYAHPYIALGVLPTLYLKSEILIVSGNGTSSDPYILSLD